jgi:hypothetical protein
LTLLDFKHFLLHSSRVGSLFNLIDIDIFIILPLPLLVQTRELASG